MTSDALGHITIAGFKSIGSIEKLALGPINVVIGPNGSGKSNFINAFSFLHEIREGRLQSYVTACGGAENILHFGSKTTEEIKFRLSFGPEVNQYDLVLAPTADDGLYPKFESVSYWDKNQYPDRPWRTGLLPLSNGREAGISNSRVTRTASWVRLRMEGWRVYHLHDTSSTSPMRKTCRVDDNKYLRSDGSNLSAFLLYLREKEPESYGLILRTVQRVAPFFQDFSLAPMQRSPENIKLEWLHKGSDRYFDASSFSDGTLRFIALSTLLLQPENHRPPVILIDEPELGLHPYAIELLAALIRQASIKTQLIVSTQSSLLLDHFEPGDVLVAERVNGGTSMRRLDEGALSSWLAEYSLGQLWEKNEFGGRPGVE